MALNLSGLKHRGRVIKVQRKRTNIKGMSRGSGQSLDIFKKMMVNYTQQPFRGKGKPRGK